MNKTKENNNIAQYLDKDELITSLKRLENEHLYADGDFETYPFVYGALTGVRQAITHVKSTPASEVVPKSNIDKLIDEFKERLYVEFRSYGPRDKFNKEAFLNAAEKVAEEMKGGAV